MISATVEPNEGDVGSHGVSVTGWSTAGNVPGIRLRFTSAELKAHLTERADYHRKRANEKKATLPDMEKTMAALADSVPTPGPSNSSNYRFDAERPVEQLKEDIKNHEQKAARFALYASHLYPHDYCLGLDHLSQLELIRV